MPAAGTVTIPGATACPVVQVTLRRGANLVGFWSPPAGLSAAALAQSWGATFVAGLSTQGRFRVHLPGPSSSDFVLRAGEAVFVGQQAGPTIAGAGVGDRITLDARTGSESQGDPLRYAWSLQAGPVLTVELDPLPATAAAHFPPAWLVMTLWWAANLDSAYLDQELDATLMATLDEELFQRSTAVDGTGGRLAPVPTLDTYASLKGARDDAKARTSLRLYLGHMYFSTYAQWAQDAPADLLADVFQFLRTLFNPARRLTWAIRTSTTRTGDSGK